MKTIALSLLAVLGLAATSARADHVTVQGSINLGVPQPAPVYYGAPNYYSPAGYWRDVAVNVWIPAHWVSRSDSYGRAINYYEPAHYEVRTQRVWVSAYADRDRRDWREHEWREHEWREHERHDRDYRR